MEMDKSKEKTNNSEENKVEKINDFSKMDSTTKSIMEQQASFKSTVSKVSNIVTVLRWWKQQFEYESKWQSRDSINSSFSLKM